MSSYYRGPIRGQKNDGAKRPYPNIGPIPLAMGGTIFIGTVAYFGLPYMKASGSTYDDDGLEELEEHFAQVWKNIVNEEHLEEGTVGQANLTEKVSQFVKNVVSTQDVTDTLADLLARVLESKRFQAAALKLIVALWEDLLADPETLAGIIKLLQKAIEDERVQESVQKLVLALIQDKKVYDELTRLLVSLGSEQRVLEATQDLLTESAHNALNDKEILSHSMEFATKLVGDESIQRTTGEALRNTVTYAVKPGLSAFFYAIGVGLIMIGIMALVNSRASEQEMEIVDRAITTVGGNMHTAAKEGFTFPFRFVQTAVHTLLTRITNAGVALVAAVTSVVVRILRIPWDLSRSMTLAVSNSISFAVKNMFAALAESVIGKVIKKTWIITATVASAVVTGLSGAINWITEFPYVVTSLVSKWSSATFHFFSNIATTIMGPIQLAYRSFLPKLASILVPAWSSTTTFIVNLFGKVSHVLGNVVTNLSSMVSSVSGALTALSSATASGWLLTRGKMTATSSWCVVQLSVLVGKAWATLDAASQTTSVTLHKLVHLLSMSLSALSSWFTGSSSTI